MRIAIAGLLALHGLVHAMGFANIFGYAEIEGASVTPTNLVSVQEGSAALDALGIVWFAAMWVFLLAAALVILRKPSWRPVALVAAVISMVPIVLWWEDAVLGAAANALVIAAVLFAPHWELETA